MHDGCQARRPEGTPHNPIFGSDLGRSTEVRLTDSRDGGRVVAPTELHEGRTLAPFRYDLGFESAEMRFRAGCPMGNRQFAWVDVVPDAVLAVRGDGSIGRANEVAEQLFGYGRGGLVGLSIEALISEASRDEHRGKAARGRRTADGLL